MKVFLSWSGDKSKAIAELFAEWLPQVIQALKPWVSSNDISAGSTWNSEIQKTLESVSFGVICLTKENKEKPWILYEAGALSKGQIANRVYTFLADLQTSDLIQNPLSSFNHTVNNKESIFKLLKDMNTDLGVQGLGESVLHKAFDKNYPEFNVLLTKILDIPYNEPRKQVTAELAILGELLDTVRDISKRIQVIEIVNELNNATNQRTKENNAFTERQKFINEPIGYTDNGNPIFTRSGFVDTVEAPALKQFLEEYKKKFYEGHNRMPTVDELKTLTSKYFRAQGDE